MSKTVTFVEQEDPTPPAKKRKTHDSSGNEASDKANGQQASVKSSAQSPQEIDESLYSRQLYVVGRDPMTRMAESEVLICGMGGLGLEIAKNIILSGVKSVTIHDEALCTRQDLSSQFYMSEGHMGDNRASASAPSLALLNEEVRVNVHTEPLVKYIVKNEVFRCLLMHQELVNDDEYKQTQQGRYVHVKRHMQLVSDFFKKFNVVVLTETSLEQQELIGAFAHEHNISLIVADTRGLAGQIFCDFGENFSVVDTNGEQLLSVLIGSITKDKEGVVTCLDKIRHGFEDGDYVTFSEVKGMTEINNCPPMKVKVLGPDTFSVGDTTQYGQYTLGGVATQVKMPKEIKFKSFKQSMAEPEFVISDFAKPSHAPQLHLGFLALHTFYQSHLRLPLPWNKDDAAEVFSIAKAKNAAMAAPLESVDERLITTLACVSAGSLCPMQAVIGSIAAQEVMKACSGKFEPIQQWFYFDAFECLPMGGDVPEAAANALEHTRYAAQARVFGGDVQMKLMAQKHFVVGAGAIGCELLKNFAMMGIGASDGLIHVTDKGVIKRSNLNGQFLFRPEDVGSLKSATAARTVLQMNPEVNIAVHEDRVGMETENLYNDEFFYSLDGVANALDNVEARQYIYRRCVYYRKPLLELCALDSKGNVQVMKPHLTDACSLSQQPPEKAIPICTIKNFPNSIEHTLQWARDEFDGLFKQSAANAVQYLKDPDFLSKALEKLQLRQKVAIIEEIKKILVDDRAIVFDDCVDFARTRFQEQYNCEIRELLSRFPANQRTASGRLFWSGMTKMPHPIEFDKTNTLHMDYVVSAANLRATMFGIPPNTNRQAIASMLEEISVPALPQKGNVRFAYPQPAGRQVIARPNEEELLERLLRELPLLKELRDVRLTTLEFEKEDDTNFHMDFILAASNLRAGNYNIKPADRHWSKQINQADATATSVAAGLACLELYKVSQNHNQRERYKNVKFNMAIPFFNFSAPPRPIIKKLHEIEFTIWTTLKVQGDITLNAFTDLFMGQYKVCVSRIVLPEEHIQVNVSDLEDRYGWCSISYVLEQVAKKKIYSGKRALFLQLEGNDFDGSKIEMPLVEYIMPKRDHEADDTPV